MNDLVTDVRRLFPFLAIAANMFLAWANGWLNALQGTGLAHPDFDASNRKIASVCGVVISIVIVLVFFKSGRRTKVNVLLGIFAAFVFSLVLTFAIARFIDYIPNKGTVVLTRTVWDFLWLFATTSLLATIGAASLLVSPDTKDK